MRITKKMTGAEILQKKEEIKKGTALARNYFKLFIQKAKEAGTLSGAFSPSISISVTPKEVGGFAFFEARRFDVSVTLRLSSKETDQRSHGAKLDHFEHIRFDSESGNLLSVSSEAFVKMISNLYLEHPNNSKNLNMQKGPSELYYLRNLANDFKNSEELKVGAEKKALIKIARAIDSKVQSKKIHKTL